MSASICCCSWGWRVSFIPLEWYHADVKTSLSFLFSGFHCIPIITLTNTTKNIRIQEEEHPIKEEVEDQDEDQAEEDAVVAVAAQIEIYPITMVPFWN
jgi:hypothetical protein